MKGDGSGGHDQAMLCYYKICYEPILVPFSVHVGDHFESIYEANLVAMLGPLNKLLSLLRDTFACTKRLETFKCR